MQFLDIVGLAAFLAKLKTTFLGINSTAKSAETLGSTTVGSNINPIYLDEGTATPSNATVGSLTRPVYLSAGTIAETGTTLEADISGNAATATTATMLGSGTVGSETTLIYLSDGTATASTSTIGSETRPVYLSNGTITLTGDNLDVNITGTADGTQSALDTHIADTNNPHNVTAAQLGLANAYKYKGTVYNYTDLPTNAENGDVYNIVAADTDNNINAGDNVAWTGAEWDNLSGIFDTSTLEGLISGKAPIYHASENTAYGVGSETLYGHIKLSDEASSNYTVSGGVAATPAAIQAAFDSIQPISEEDIEAII